MGKLMGIVAAVGALVIVGALSANVVSAESVYRASEKSSSTISSDETIDGSAYLAGNSVRVSGTVKGDVYCAGSSITVDGTVDGDVLCAGSNVTVNGTVMGDVRLAGATVTLGGVVRGNATVFGANVVADSSLDLGGDLTGGASSLTIDGVIGRDMTAGSELLVVNGVVGRDVISAFNNVEFGENGVIKGNLSYTSPKESAVPDGAVTGETTFTMSKDRSSGSTDAVSPIAAIIGVLAIGLLAVLGVIVVPRQVHAAADISWGRFGVAVVVGLTFVTVAPIAALMLIATGVGVAIAYAVILIWLLVMAIAPVTVAYFIGSKVYGSKTPHVLIRVTIGALILMLALLLPVINIITFIIMVLAGVGMAFLGVPRLYEGNPYQVATSRRATKKTST